MKVLIVSCYYAPEIGAAPSRITNMAEGLHQQGAEVDVLTCLPNYPTGHIFKGYRDCFHKTEHLNGINVYRYWTFASISKNPFIRLLEMCAFSSTLWAFAWKRRKIRSYDKVIIQTPPILVAVSAMLLFACIYGKQTVLNVSDLWPLSAVELKAVRAGSLTHRVMTRMERFIYRHSTMYQGQSEEIVQHIQTFEPVKPSFLYRNLQQAVPITIAPSPRQPLKIVYAGLFGVAQDILSIIEQVNFKKLNAEFHLYGGGNQVECIKNFIASHDTGVFYHGYVEKQYMASVIAQYHASIVPLTVRIRGAVPSKIYDLLPIGIPILFCGGGEGAEIVQRYKVGYVSDPGDISMLKANIEKIEEMSDEAYLQLRTRCVEVSTKDFSFDQQMLKYYQFLQNSET